MTDAGIRLMEYNVMVKLDPVEEKTSGGIFLPPSAKDKEEAKNDEGTLVGIAAHAFSYAEWPSEEHKPKYGDRVLFARYAGTVWEQGGHKYRILKDKEIIGVIDQQPALAAAA